MGPLFDVPRQPETRSCKRSKGGCGTYFDSFKADDTCPACTERIQRAEQRELERRRLLAPEPTMSIAEAYRQLADEAHDSYDETRRIGDMLQVALTGRLSHERRDLTPINDRKY
jgi:hypothetical protein